MDVNHSGFKNKAFQIFYEKKNIFSTHLFELKDTNTMLFIYYETLQSSFNLSYAALI